MAKFEKLSFWYMCAMSFVTIGLYPLAWLVDTARQLRSAGGRVPSTYFYFGPILIGIAIYILVGAAYMANGFDVAQWAKIWGFWFMAFFSVLSTYFLFGYISAYCQIVRHKNDNKTIWTYFILFVVCNYGFAYILKYASSHIANIITNTIQYFGFMDFVMNIINDHPVIIWLFGYVGQIIWINLINFLFFQCGFNTYVEQHNG